MARGATRKQQRATRRPVMQGWQRLIQRLLTTGLLLALAGLLAVGGHALLTLPVERVVVTGDLEHVDRSELQAMLSAALAGGFLWQDLEGLRQPLESLPWVHRVVVRRQWPDSIEVRVLEQRPIALWGEAALLNHTGEVFAADAPLAMPALPRLSGPKGSHADMMHYYLQVQQSLQGLGLQVAGLKMDLRGGLTASLSDGSRLVFGRGGLAGKLARFETLFANRLANRRGELATVDLRYSHGAAVAWRQLPAEEEKT